MTADNLISGCLSFLPPVDHILSELSTMTPLSWVALHSMAHSFIELHKPLHHDKAVIHEGDRSVSIALYILDVCELSHFSRVRFFMIPWTVAYQAPLFMGFSGQEYWSGLPCPPRGDLPNPWTEPMSPISQADSLPLSHQGIPV